MALRHATLVLLATGLSTTVGAQPRRTGTDVGGVGEIVVVGQLQGCPSAPGPATAAAVRIVRDGQVRIVPPGGRERVRIDDAFFVERHTDARLLIASRELGRGTFTLAPQLLCSVRGAYRAFRPYGVVDTASYAITLAADGALQLGVNSGGALVRWIRSDSNPRPLVVVAGGRPIRVVGTEFAVAADSVAGTALVHVREGLLRFPEVPNATAGPGQLLELTPRPPLATPPTQATRAQVLRVALQDIDRHRLLFPLDVPPLPTGAIPTPPRRSLWSRPLTYVVVAVAAGAGYCGIVSDSKCGLSSGKSTPSRSGGAVVEIPL